MAAMKLKMCDPSKVKCPHATLFEQPERPLSTKQARRRTTNWTHKKIQASTRQRQVNCGDRMVAQVCQECRTMHQQDREWCQGGAQEKQWWVIHGMHIFEKLWQSQMWELKENFQTQCTLNDNQCPKKTSAVSNVSSGHQWDQAHNKCQKKRQEHGFTVSQDLPIN